MLAPTGFFLSLHIRLFIAELQSGAELQIVRVGVGETIKRKEGCLSRVFSNHIFNIGHSQYGQLTAVKTR